MGNLYECFILLCKTCALCDPRPWGFPRLKFSLWSSSCSEMVDDVSAVFLLVSILWGFVASVDDYKYLGCYVDGQPRLLDGAEMDSPQMAPSLCGYFCESRYFRFAGLQYRTQCFCGNSIENGRKAVVTDCQYQCPGDSSARCGGNWKLSIYETSYKPDLSVSTGDYKYLGCYTDSLSRLLDGTSMESSKLTPGLCAQYCELRSYRFAGLQYRTQCFCGNHIENGQPAAAKDCHYSCPGDSSAKCGGDWRLNLYETSFKPGFFVSAEEYTYRGCYVDNVFRLLNGASMSSTKLAPVLCVYYCHSRSYQYAGLQYRTQCFCGNSIDKGQQADINDCRYSCPGNRTVRCGGDWRLSVYETTPKPGELQPTAYMGCFVDPSTESRLMRGASGEFKGRLTNPICHQFCRKSGMKYAGTQSGFKCFCSNQRPSYKVMAGENECDSNCDGAPGDKCGGKLRLSVYDLSPGDGTDPVDSMYNGCYPVGSKENLLSIAKFDFNNLAPINCISFCYRQDFTMAGMKMGNECYCGDQLEKTSRTSETQCNVPCKGNSLLKCGGNSHMNIYYTGVPDKRSMPRYYYLGCYEDDTERILKGISKTDKGLVPKICAEFCYRKNFLYAGTEFGEQCFCSDELPQNKKVGEHECNSPCKGDSSQRCGGSRKLSVYIVSLADNGTFENHCKPSESRFGNNEVCKGQILFIEDFNSSPIDGKKWIYSTYMPLAPDYQFVTLRDKEQNIYIKEGKLVIKPTLLDDYTVKYGSIELKNCTSYIYSGECSKTAASFSILPPVESSMIDTHNSFSFQYGKIEIRAKLPLGDWLYPALWLKPKYDSYGPFYSSGRIVLAMARGNANLECDGKDLSSRTLEAGIMAGVRETMAKKMVELKLNEGWHTQFHNFSFTWTSESLSFSVDGGQENYLLKKGENIKDVINFDNPRVQWKSATPIAPFDKEFYISLGLFAGGMTDFPDSCKSGGQPKPWRNKAVKALANFWQAKEQWFGTWNNEDSALQIDYIKVIAL